MDRVENGAVFSSTVLGIEPHPAQVRYLLDQHQTKVLVGGRRSGKTTALAAEVVFHSAKALRDRKPFRQLLIAPAVDQARLLFTAVSQMLAASPLGGVVESEIQSPFSELRLPWGGLIFVRAAHENGKLLRGHSADRVVVDEAAYLLDSVIEESIGPLLADSGGQLVLASTPAAKGALFHRYFEQGQDGRDPRVRSFTMKSTDNPHVDRSYIEAQRNQISERQWIVEYLGEFSDQTDCVFRWEHLAACATGEEQSAISGHRYVVGWDPALKHDKSGLAILDSSERPWRVVRVLDLKGSDYIEQVRQVAELAKMYNGAKVIVDETAHGQVLVELLRRTGVWVEGLTFTNTSKAELVTRLAVMIERHELIFPANKCLVRELRYYEARTSSTGRVRYGAPEGGKTSDDLVTAIALAVRGAGGGPRPMSLAEAGLPPFLTSSGSLPMPGGPQTIFVASPGDWDGRMWVDHPEGFGR